PAPKPPLVIGPAPYAHTALTRQSITAVFVTAMLPALGVSVYLFGWTSLLTAGLAIAGAYLAEVLAHWARGRRLWTSAGPALVTGLVLALSLPPDVPIWLPVLGAFFGVMVAQELFGVTATRSSTPRWSAGSSCRSAFQLSWTGGSAPSNWSPPQPPWPRSAK